MLAIKPFFARIIQPRFDAWLKAQGSHRGIRDIEQVNLLANSVGFTPVEDNAMPANNRLLIWELTA